MGPFDGRYVLTADDGRDYFTPYSHSLEFFPLFLNPTIKTIITTNDYPPIYLSYLESEWGIKGVFKKGNPTQWQNWWRYNKDFKKNIWSNSKETSWKFNQLYKFEDFPDFCLSKKEEILRLEKELPKSPYNNWVLKSFHGLSGSGHKFYKKKELVELVTKAIERNVIASPWVERVRDFGHKVYQDNTYYYRQYISKLGRFEGASLDLGQSENISFPISAEKLSQFYGDDFPYQIDGFTYKDYLGNEKTCILCEINQRITMTDLLFQALRQKKDYSCGVLKLSFSKNREYDFEKILDWAMKNSNKDVTIYPISANKYGINFILYLGQQMDRLYFSLPEDYSSI